MDSIQLGILFIGIGCLGLTLVTYLLHCALNRMNKRIEHIEDYLEKKK